MGVSGVELRPEIRGEIARLRASGLGQRQVAASLGISPGSVSKYWNAEAIEPPDGPTQVREETDEKGGTRTVEFLVPRPIRTLEEAVAAANVDLKVWFVDRWESSAWGVALKLKAGKDSPDVPACAQMHRVKLYLKRILPKLVQDVTEEVFRRLESRRAIYIERRPRTRPKRPRALEVDLFDVHFGKLAWAAECGHDWDVKITDRVYREAVDDVLDEHATTDFERIIFPFGNDFLHVNNMQNTTGSGTPVDTDGRLQKIWVTAEEAVIYALERAAEVAPVRVYYVEDNHAPTLTWAMCRVISRHFGGTGRVTVDCEPKSRKYHRYGAGLIGFAHGHQVKPDRLPVLMAQEARADWAETSWHEWHLGHLHREKKFEIFPTETYEGVVVRYLRALSATDAWHHKNGFVGGSRAAESYIWDREFGLSGFHVSRIRR